MSDKKRCLGILTSGGDAPGMNAAIRAVTRTAIYNGFDVKAIYRGYKGLIDDEIVDFKTQNVSNIIQMGGTILKTARCKEFQTHEGRRNRRTPHHTRHPRSTRSGRQNRNILFRIRNRNRTKRRLRR